MQTGVCWSRATAHSSSLLALVRKLTKLSEERPPCRSKRPPPQKKKQKTKNKKQNQKNKKQKTQDTNRDEGRKEEGIAELRLFTSPPPHPPCPPPSSSPHLPHSLSSSPSLTHHKVLARGVTAGEMFDGRIRAHTKPLAQRCLHRAVHCSHRHCRGHEGG